ncbi:hypothetical protein C8R44DRAFT_823245 [Mycena epipterygia]|nr:hypothetical protein C8R44DRAFT_823245 [Mycena epipterygia]
MCVVVALYGEGDFTVHILHRGRLTQADHSWFQVDFLYASPGSSYACCDNGSAKHGAWFR